MNTPVWRPQGGGRQYNPDSTVRRILHKYMKHAEDAGRVFDLTFEQVRTLLSGQCTYCGIAPSNSFNIRNGTRRQHYLTPAPEFLYSGIDRVDNSKGYTISNCVSCCIQCNVAKRSMSLAEFAEMIVSIAARHEI